ncbi:Monocarboxylate transporter 9-like protein, partial [Dinothrombium tinctorium]
MSARISFEHSPPKDLNRNISIESETSTTKFSNKPVITENAKFVPPDGGWGWVVVFASFMISLIADGISTSFGILFIDLTEYFKAGRSKTAWVGSLFLSIPLLLGPLASALTDHYGCRKVTIISGLISSMGFVIGFFAQQLEHLFIASTVSGIGLSLSYVTGIVIVAYYFEKRRSLATGLSVCGTGIGTGVFPYLTRYLLIHYSWRGTLLIMSGFLLNIVVFGALMRDLDIDDDETESSCDSDSEVQSIGNDTFSSNANNHSNLMKSNVSDSHHISSSLINIPTYITNRNSTATVPHEVLNEISARKGGYLWQLLQRYPNLLSAFLTKEEQTKPTHNVGLTNENQTAIVKTQEKAEETPENVALVRSPSKKQSSNTVQCRLNSLLPFEARSHCLRNMKLQRGSLTYRSAMLNIRRYRLRALSAPDIYRNSMVTIDTSEPITDFMHDVKEVLLDIVDFSNFKSFKYTLFCFSNFLLYACIDIPYVYLPDHAISTGAANKETSSFLISVIGMINTFGIVIVGYFGDKPWIEATTLYSILICLGGLSMSLLPWVHSYKRMAFLASVYGFAISANYSLVSVILVDIISLDKFTNGYGLLLLVQGIASLIGPPIAGWLFDVTGNYKATFFTSGICILVSGLSVLPVTKTSYCSTKTQAKESSSRSSSPEETKIETFNSLKQANGRDSLNHINDKDLS